MVCIQDLLKTHEIVCIQEHWLYGFEASFLQNLSESHSYFVKCVDDHDPIDPTRKPRGHGGVGIFWPSEWDTKVTKHDDGDWRFVVITIRGSEANVCIVSVYMPCRGYSAAVYMRCLDSLWEIISKYSANFIILVCGDFNACPINPKDSRDKMLSSFCEDLGLATAHEYYSGSSFIHHGGQGESKIDHILSLQWQEDLIVRVTNMKDHPTNTSDHSPIVAVMPNIIKRLPKDTDVTAPTRYDWDKIDHKKYSQILHRELDYKIQVTSDRMEVNQLLHISNAIKKATDRAVPLRKRGKKGTRHKTWSPTIAKLIKVSKKLHWKRKMAPTKKVQQALKIECKEAKKSLRREQRQHHASKRAHQYAKLMQASSEDDQLFFNIIRKHRRVHKTEGTELLVNGATVVNKEEVKEAWADHFESLATPANNVNFDEDFKKEIDEGMSTINSLLSNSPANISPISHEEVARAIGKLKRNKAADIEGLCAEHILYGEAILIPHLTALFNSILLHAHIPPAMKKGYVVPIPKKGKDSRLTNNYRGISITPIIGKVLEHVIQQRLRLQTQHQQNELQKGFTKGSSSNNAVLVVSETIAEARDLKKELFIASLDAQKAFDVVYQDAMLYKLFYADLHPALWRLMFDMYQGATNQVKLQNDLSRPIKLLQGVRQGSVLSTDCYKIFINNLLDRLKRSGAGTKIGDVFVGSPTCADDVLLAADSAHDLQFMLQIVADYASEHRYIINPDKSTVLVYNSKTSSETWKEANYFQLGKESLTVDSECTHLGILLSSNKVQSQLIDERIQLARRTTYALMGVGLHGNDGVSPLLSARLLSTFVMPRYLHGLEAVVLKDADVSKLQKYQKRILKKAQHLPERMADEAVYLLIGELPVEAVIDKQRLTMFGAIVRSDSVEKKLAYRQLSIKDSKSSSWFVQVSNDLCKYGLPDAHKVLKEKPSKNSWKEQVTCAVNEFWYQKLRGAKLKSSLKYINWDHVQSLHPHHVWSTVNLNVKDVQRAAVKVRLMTGTYTLQEKKAKYYSGTDPTCLLCMQAPETITHFLLSCQELQPVRVYHMQQIHEVVVHCYSEATWTDIQNQELMVQLIMDCTAPGVLPTPPDSYQLNKLESATRRYCYALHWLRKRLTDENGL